MQLHKLRIMRSPLSLADDKGQYHLSLFTFFPGFGGSKSYSIPSTIPIVKNPKIFFYIRTELDLGLVLGKMQ